MNRLPRYTVAFYQTSRGHEPVREWLKALPAEARRIVGEDLKTVQYGWPLGMPLIRKLEADLWEVRSTLPDGIARVLFTVQGMRVMFMLSSKKAKRLPRMNWRWPGNG